MTLLVIVTLTGIIAIVARTITRELRGWVWFALVEYLAAACGQLFYSRVVVDGGDTLLYSRTGAELSRLLDSSFSWAFPEVVAMLFQRPSALDALGEQSNTGSMYAVASLLIFALRSEYAAHFFFTGLGLLGALATCSAFLDAYPQASPRRILAATVLFPSVAFWTAAIHKETLGVLGIGLVLVAWRAMYARKFGRMLACGLVGVTLVLVFRAPLIAPLFMGLALFVVFERLQHLRGVDAVILGPAYFVAGVALLAVGILGLARFAPAFSVDRLADTIAVKQQTWTLSRGGSALQEIDDAAPTTLGGQLRRLPLALLNALFRPQLFDVKNFGALLSALEMTALSWLVILSLRVNGLTGLIRRVQRAPFLLMCAVITLVGCSFVGLVTLNLGTLVRYRVPVLPFYGALLTILSVRPSPVQRRSSAPSIGGVAHRDRSRRRRAGARTTAAG